MGDMARGVSLSCAFRGVAMSAAGGVLEVKSGHVAAYQVQDVCQRCGGEGGWQGGPGFTCYGCGGHGEGRVRTVKVYSAEKLAKLNVSFEKRQAKQQEKRIAEAALVAEKRATSRLQILTAN